MLECRSGRRRSVEDHLVNDPDRVPVSGSWDRAVFAFIVRLLGDGLRALPDDGVNGGTAKAGCSGDLRHPGSFRVHSLGHGLLLGFNEMRFPSPSPFFRPSVTPLALATPNPKPTTRQGLRCQVVSIGLSLLFILRETGDKSRDSGGCTEQCHLFTLLTPIRGSRCLRDTEVVNRTLNSLVEFRDAPGHATFVRA
jgi:hypothetical protein